MGDRRRTQRVETIAQALAEQPGVTIPELFDRKYDIQAAYDLFARPEATPDAIQAGHRRWVKAQLRTPGRYLLIEDTSFLSFTHRPGHVEGLGPIGGSGEGQQGFLLHSVLAVRATAPTGPDATGRRGPLEVLGFADQQSLIRTPRPPGEPRGNASRRQRERESQRWLDSGTRIGPAPPEAAIRWVRVADREADIYEYLQGCRDLGHGFLVRVTQDRVLLDPATGQRQGLVFDHVAGVEPAGGLYLKLRGRPGVAPRRAKLLISFGPIRLRSPERTGQAAGAGPPVDCWFVRAWETEPPEGVEPLEWVLYGDQEVATLEAALGVVMDYGSRFFIEEFHKGLKTGLKAERLQLETGSRLFAAIAVMSVVALRLIDLRELGRSDPTATVERTGLELLELAVLGLATHRELTTVAEVLLAIGRLGGHMNRVGDGMPGWITLWRGMTKLRLLVQGAKLGQELDPTETHGQYT